MNKKVSKIIAGISVLGCVGAFLPNSANACDGWGQQACNANKNCTWHPRVFHCEGYYNQICMNAKTPDDCNNLIKQGYHCAVYQRDGYCTYHR